MDFRREIFATSNYVSLTLFLSELWAHDSRFAVFAPFLIVGFLIFALVPNQGLLSHVSVDAAPSPNFTISAKPDSLLISPGGSNTSAITLHGIHGFVGEIRLVTRSPTIDIVALMSPPAVTITQTNQTAVSTLEVSSTPLVSAGNHTVTVIATSTSEAITHSIRVTIVVPNPPSLFTIAASCGPAFLGSPVTCSVSPTGGIPPYSFAWSAPGGTPGSGVGSNFTTTYAAKGTTTVIVAASDSAGATASANVTITVVDSHLILSVTCGLATASKPVTCNVTASGGTIPYYFTWSALYGNPSSGTGSNFTTTFATKGTYSVYATVTDANRLNYTRSTSVIVAAQTLEATVSCGAATAGQTFNCTLSVQGGSPAYMITWAAEGANPSTGTGPAFTTSYATKGTYPISASVSDANGSTITIQTSVTVRPQSLSSVFTFTPTAPFTGQTVLFTSSATGGTAPYSSFWDFGDGSTGNGNQIQHSFSAANNFTIALTLTDTNGVSVTVSHTVTVAVSPSFTADFTVGVAIAGQPVDFTAATNGGEAPYSFSWDFGDSSIGYGQTSSHAYASRGTYPITLTVRDNMGATATAVHSLVVAPAPLTVDFSISSSSATSGLPVNMSATASGGTGPYSLSWSFGDGTTGTGVSPQHTYSVTGTFNIVVTATDSDGMTAAQTHTITVHAAGSPPNDQSSPPNPPPSNVAPVNPTTNVNLPLILLIAGNASMLAIAFIAVPNIRKKRAQKSAKPGT